MPEQCREHQVEGIHRLTLVRTSLCRRKTAGMSQECDVVESRNRRDLYLGKEFSRMTARASVVCISLVISDRSSNCSSLTGSLHVFDELP